MRRGPVSVLIICLLITGVTAALWVRSESHGDAFVFRRSGTATDAPDPQAESVRIASVAFSHGDVQVTSFAGWQSPSDDQGLLPPVAGWTTATDAAYGDFFDPAAHRWWRFGWAVRHRQPGETARQFGCQITTPVGPWMTLFGLSTLAAAWRASRPRRWSGRGRCRRCGYDLRGSPGRCPECGTVNKAADGIGGATADCR